MNCVLLMTLQVSADPFHFIGHAAWAARGARRTQNLGAVPTGQRVTFPITGGDFQGERLHGRVLPGGADWTLQSADGAVELDLHVSLETHDGALVHMTFSGVRDDAHGYFRI